MNMPFGPNNRNHNNNSNIASPCVRQCCLDAQDVCLGCHRSLDEILAWHTMDDQQKIALLETLQQRAIACKKR
ncbi:DUF1289 domain-containing protein [Shewanella livingstonensis]|uniref:DUF1289 domain-containing protein n=2 Tax=Shewanella livingstonensis TaxID=150120 RepID=A0A3G8LTK4_9GAMM|nr:DUF1289 domain-containing protein [Shewanella livingstonensis]AZG72956.1 DUF1289 domain-containing protein [Shewanella livingstonensis]